LNREGIDHANARGGQPRTQPNGTSWPYSGLLRVIFLPNDRVRPRGKGESTVESEKRPQSRQNNAQCILKRFNQEEVG
jgi:hypothetical protein